MMLERCAKMGISPQNESFPRYCPVLIPMLPSIESEFFDQTPDGRTVLKEITEFKVTNDIPLSASFDRNVDLLYLRSNSEHANSEISFSQTDENGNRIKCTRRIQTTKKTVRVNRYIPISLRS